MLSEENNIERADKPTESGEKSNVLSEKESNAVQEQATEKATERRRFLETSLGKKISPSTAMLVNIVPEIYDGVKKIVGFFTGERSKVQLPGDLDGGLMIKYLEDGGESLKAGSVEAVPRHKDGVKPEQKEVAGKDVLVKTEDAGAKAKDEAKETQAKAKEGESKAKEADAEPKDVGPAKHVDENAMKKAAQAIRDACEGGGTDPDTIYAVLKDKTQAERDAIKKIYEKEYGITLEKEFAGEMEGAQLDKAMNLLNRKDGSSDRAGRIHEALLERDQLVEGRTDETCEKDIRDTLATMNSDQIAQLDQEYRARYGVGLKDALLNDPNLSDGTKKAIEIYLKGTDRRDEIVYDKDGKPQFHTDTMKLAQIALEAEDIDMFQEAFRSASPEARKHFLGTTVDGKTGEERIKDAFWGTDEDRALEYARDGKLGLTTLLKENQSWLGDNEAAIEKSLEKMTDADRKQYLKGKELAAAGTDAVKSEEDKKALEFYTAVHDQLKDAGNETEIARWEDMIAHKGGTLVSKLTRHEGNVYDDSLNDVAKTVENMSPEDWQRLKGPDGEKYKKEIEKALKTYLDDDDVKRCMEIVDKKMAAGSFDEASKTGRRALTEIIEDSSGKVNDDEDSVFDAISKMTPEEQEKYRTSEKFRKEVDEKIASVLDKGDEQAAARAMLDKVLRGEAPKEDIISKLHRHAAHTDTDEAAVVRDLVKEFKENPELRKQIMNPETPEQKEFSEKFFKSLHKALDNTEFQKYAVPLLETGHLPLSVQMDLNEHWYDDDEQGFYKDVLAVAELPGDWSTPEKGAEREKIFNDPEYRQKYLDSLKPEEREAAKARLDERDKILKDPEYKQQVLGELSDEERQVAIYTLEQGEMRPEDKLRSYMVGAGTSEAEIKEVLSKLSPQEKELLKSEYAKKYGSDLSADLLDELGGQDAVEAGRALRREPENAAAAFDAARDEYYQSRDGIGKAWVDAMWDGTGYQSDEALNEFAGKMTEYSARFEEMPEAEQKRLMENLQQQLDLFRESKMGVADAVTDAGIAVGCLALAVGGFFTKGGTWVILGTLIATGAIKMGAKGAIVGADYDWGSSQALYDFAAGGIDAALNFVSFGAGGSAAKSVLKAGGKALIKEGAEEALEKGMKAIIKESLEKGIKKGGAEFSEEAIKELTERLAKQGADKAQLELLIREGLDKGVKEASESLIKTMAVTAAEGSIGGAGSGAVQGVAAWDTNKSFSENMAMVGKVVGQSAAFGAAGAAAGAVVFKVGGKAYHAIKEHYKLKPGEIPSPETLKAIEKDVEKASGQDVEVRAGKDGDVEVVPAKAGDASGAKKGDTPPARTSDAARDVTDVKPGDVPPTKQAAKSGELDDAQKGIQNAEVIKGKGKHDLPPGDTRATKVSSREVLDKVGPNHQFSAGETVMVEGSRAHVLGRDGDRVVVGHAGEVAGHGVPEGQYDLKKFQRIEAGDQTYYKNEAGEYYRLNKNKELVLDSDVKAVPRDKVDGVVRDIVFHDPGTSEEGQVRLRKEMAAYDINKKMEFENGFPVTTPKEVDGVKGFAQEHGGKKLDSAMQKMAAERYPQSEYPHLYKDGNADEAISKMLREDPELKKAVEEALLERVLLGDDDPHSGNLLISRDANGKYTVRNIDLDAGFGTHPTPEMSGGPGIGLNNRMFLDFSEKPISPDLREKVAKFVQKYDTPEGRKELSKAGLKQEEVDAYLSRARTLSETGKFPRAQFPEDVLQSVEVGTRHGNEVVAETYGDNVILSRDNPKPLEFKPVSEKELAGFKQVHGSDIAVGEDGQFYRLRKAADGTTEIAHDPNLRDMPREEFLDALENAGDQAPPSSRSDVTPSSDRAPDSGPQPDQRLARGSDDETGTEFVLKQRTDETGTEFELEEIPPTERTQSRPVETDPKLAPPKPGEAPKDLTPDEEQVFKRADVEEQFRHAAIEDARHNPLYGDDAIDGFAPKAAEVVEEFKDLSQKIQASNAREQEAFGKFNTEVREPLVQHLKRGGASEVEARELAGQSLAVKTGTPDPRVKEFFDSNPEKMKYVDDLSQLQQERAAIHVSQEQHKAKVAELINDFNKQHGLPPAKVEFASPPKINTAGHYLDGVLVINEAAMTKDPGELMKVLYHENVHNQQDFMNLRRCADLAESELGQTIGQPPSARELETIRRIYQEKKLGPLSEAHLEAALKARNGQRLDDAQTRMIDRQIEHWPKEGLGPTEHYRTNIRDVVNAAHNLNNQPGYTKGLLEQLNNDPNLSRHLIGPSENLSKLEQQQLQSFLKAAKEGASFDEAQAKQLLHRLMQRNHDQLQTAVQALDKQYMNLPHEMEAWLVHEKFDAKMKEAATTPSEAAPTGRRGAANEEPTPSEVAPTGRRGPVSEDPATLDEPTRDPETLDQPTLDEPTLRTPSEDDTTLRTPPSEDPATVRRPTQVSGTSGADGDPNGPATKRSADLPPAVEKPAAPKKPEPAPPPPPRTPQPLPDGVEPVPPTLRPSRKQQMMALDIDDAGQLEDIAASIGDAVKKLPEIDLDIFDDPTLTADDIGKAPEKLNDAEG